MHKLGRIDSKKPNLFLVGGPKCGTTSFQEYLAGHPQIYMSVPKEPCYFDTDMPWPDSPRNEAEYLQYFNGVGPEHVIIGEASTNYLYSKVAVPNILAFNPDARFIVMIRNPIDMAISLHSYSVQEMTEDVTDFEEAWRLQGERANGRSLPRLNYHQDFVLYGRFCRLGEQLQRLYSHVQRERVSVVLFDDLKRDPARTYKRVLEFLDLQDDGREVFPVRNTTGIPKSQALHNMLALFLAIRQSLPLPRLGVDFFARLKQGNLAVGRRSQPSPEFRAELAAYFRPDVELLSKLVGRDLLSWLIY